jgi:hypothetical protein
MQYLSRVHGKNGFANAPQCYVIRALSVFFILTLDGGEWSGSRLGRFTATEKAFVSPSTGDYLGPRTGLDNLGKVKSYFFRQEFVVINCN